MPSKQNDTTPNEHQGEQVAAHQRKYFNALAGVFDVPQPEPVMDRLKEIVASSEMHSGDVVLDVGTGAGVLLPLIRAYQPSMILACDLAEQMLARVCRRHPAVRTVQCDIVWLPLKTATVDVVFMNAMYGNVADKPAACSNVSRVLKPGGRLVVSHPEGRGFVEGLRAAGGLFIESFPQREEFETLLAPLGLEIITYRDEPKLYLMVARKVRSPG